VLHLRGGILQGDPCIATTSDPLSVPICVLIIPDSSTIAFWQLPAETPSSEAGKTWRELAVNFTYEVFRFILHGSLTRRKILLHETDGFNSSPKESVQWITNALKNASSSARV
jgi:hypothetical protein